MQPLIQLGQSLLQNTGERFRQNIVQIAQGYTGTIGRRNCTKLGAGTVGQEIADQLTGRVIVLTACTECGGFNFALPIHAAQRTFVGEVLRMEGNQQCCIGVFSVPGHITHAVGAKATFLRCSGDHMAAGTHTEGIGRTAVIQLNIQLVIGSGQIGVTGKGTVLSAVDKLLLVLDSHTHGERFGFHGNALLMQLLEGIPGAVADGKDQMAAGEINFFTCVGVP